MIEILIRFYDPVYVNVVFFNLIENDNLFIDNTFMIFFQDRVTQIKYGIHEWKIR